MRGEGGEEMEEGRIGGEQKGEWKEREMSEKEKKQRSRRDRKEEGEGGQEDSWRWRKN